MKKRWLALSLQTLFVLWLILVNALYYAQYRDLLLIRLGKFTHLWR